MRSITTMGGAALLAAALLGGCDGGDSSTDIAELEISQAAVDGKFGTHVSIYEEWYQGPTRGDLADDSDLIDTALDAALSEISHETDDKYNNGEVMGEPRAVFAVDTAYGSVVYAIGHIEYHIDAESNTASDVPLPFGVVVMLDDQGEVAETSTETPVSQAESATGPPRRPIGLAAYADPSGDQLLVLDTGPTPWVKPGLRRSDDPAHGPIAVETPRERPDLSKTGFALLDTSRTVPYTAELGIADRRLSGVVTGPWAHSLYFEALSSCCPTKTIDGEAKNPLSMREARDLTREILGDRISPSVRGGYGVYQAILPDGGIALIQDVSTMQTVAARLGDGRDVAAWCVNPAEVKSFVCRVPTTGLWIAGTDTKLQVRADDGSWETAADLPGHNWTTITLVDGDAPQVRVKSKGEWVTVDLEQAYEQAG